MARRKVYTFVVVNLGNIGGLIHLIGTIIHSRESALIYDNQAPQRATSTNLTYTMCTPMVCTPFHIYILRSTIKDVI